ncbi:MAG TPA: hypothetical protein VF316_21770 [Polyangiaceae bacterium]
MPRAFVRLLLLVVGCLPREPAAVPEVVLPLATPNAVTSVPTSSAEVKRPQDQEGPVAESFEGEYTSVYGDVKLEQRGDDVSATYPNGTMTCVAHGPHLDCAWDEGGSVGRAMLTRQPRGNIVGTWGYGSSDSDGGAWTMERK